MFFDGTLGHACDLGDLGIGAAMDAIEQKDVPGALRQAAQGRLDLAQIIARLQRRLRLTALGVRLGLPMLVEPVAAAFAAQMIDGDVARATQQISAEFLDLNQGPPPEPQKQILNQIGGRGPTAHAAADQRFHLWALG